MDKLISVIIPCYNVENYIDRCFESIANQTIGLDKLVVILVDDCSTDNTWDHLVKIEKNNQDSVVVIHLDENGRQGRARNIAMDYVTTEYVLYVDSDDYIDADVIEALYTPMKTHNYDFTVCGFWRDDGNVDYTKYPKYMGVGDKHFVIDTVDKRKTFICCMSAGLTAWAKLYRKDFLIDNGIYFAEGYVYEDHMFIALLYAYACDILILDNVGYHYCVNETSTVLSTEIGHHYDVIPVDDMTWDELAMRGFLNEFRKEWECYFLLLAYLGPLKLVSLRLEKVPYDYFQKLKQAILNKVGDYSTNPYISVYVTPFLQQILRTLSLPISEEELQSVCAAIRNYYG